MSDPNFTDAESVRIAFEQVIGGIAQAHAGDAVEQRAARRVGQCALARRAQRLEPGELGQGGSGGHVIDLYEKYLTVKTGSDAGQVICAPPDCHVGVSFIRLV